MQQVTLEAMRWKDLYKRVSTKIQPSIKAKSHRNTTINIKKIKKYNCVMATILYVYVVLTD